MKLFLKCTNQSALLKKKFWYINHDYDPSLTMDLFRSDLSVVQCLIFKT